jgi:uroporphyrinogen decarboxylase
MKPLTSRERVRMVLSHQEPDRVPTDLGGRVTTIHNAAYRSLATELGLDLPEPHLDPFLSVMDPHPSLLEALGVDFQYLYLKGPEYCVARRNDDDTYDNEWGIRVKTVGLHSQRVGHPLEHATINDLAGYPWPVPDDPERIAGLEQRTHDLFHGTSYALTAAPVSGGLFEFGQHLRGMAAFMMDLASDPAFANQLLDRLLDIQIGLWSTFLDVVGDAVEIVQLADDFGAQKSLLISPRTFRTFFKPRYRRLIDSIKQKTHAKVFLHCDGAIAPIIPDLIEMGVDVLNPLQPTADGMEPASIKARFGQQLSFHGAIDNQRLLVTGTPEEVRARVGEVIAALAPGGGYILAAAHIMEPDMPVANILAMFRAARELGQYSQPSP